MMCQTRNGGRYGAPIPQVHRRVQAAGGGALPRARVHVRGARPRAGLRRGRHVGLGQEGGRRGRGARPKPLPDGRGAAQAEARERPPEDRERDTLKSRRLLRRPSAVGPAAKGAKFAFISANGGSWRVSDMCPALVVTGRGHYAWRRRGPSARDLGDAEPARPIPGVCKSSGGVCGAPKAHVNANLRFTRWATSYCASTRRRGAASWRRRPPRSRGRGRGGRGRGGSR